MARRRDRFRLFYCRSTSLDLLKVRNVGFHSVEKTEDDMNYDLSKLRAGAGRFEEAVINFPVVWGFHAAIQTINELGIAQVEKHILSLTELAIERLQAKGYFIKSSLLPEERSGILSFRHPRMPSTTIRDKLFEAAIDVGVRDGNIRISPGIYNTEADIVDFVEALPPASACQTKTN